jgi:hypothetical protein
VRFLAFSCSGDIFCCFGLHYDTVSQAGIQLLGPKMRFKHSCIPARAGMTRSTFLI